MTAPSETFDLPPELRPLWISIAENRCQKARSIPTGTATRPHRPSRICGVDAE